MGSTLSTLRTLMESRLGLGFTTSASTDPTSTTLNSLINESIKKIAREEDPWELLNETPSYLDQTASQRVATLPSTLIMPKRVYAKSTGGTWKEILPRSLETLIEIETPNSYLNNKTGNVDFYAVRGTKIIFNKVFPSTVSNGIAVFATSRPTALSGDSDTTSLDINRDLQIVYGACILLYQSESEDNGSNLSKYLQLYRDECSKLKSYFEPDNQQTITYDQSIFSNQRSTIQNPNVLFTS